MGVITISLKDEDEQKLRQYAQQKYGSKKGAIARVIAEAVADKMGKDEVERIKREVLELLHKGFHLDIKKFNRDEAHER